MKIFLVGFMASGKSTYGPLLANELGISFIDLDEVIEAKSGLAVSDWFAASGEEAFREFERDTLLSLCVSDDSFVLAAGGGTPAYHENMQRMNQCGSTVYLKLEDAELIRRLNADRSNRPKLSSLSNEELETEILSLLHTREPRYEESHLIWKPEMHVSDIAERVQLLEGKRSLGD